MALTGSILGNGPSRKNFDRSGHITIGCNIPDDQFPVDATVITDVEVIRLIATQPSLISCPTLLVSSKAYEAMKLMKIADHFDVRDVFKTHDWHTSAHYAALYLSWRCSTINVWGCDSYFVDDASSSTDQLVPKSGGVFFPQWRRTWDYIVASYPAINFDFKR